MASMRQGELRLLGEAHKPGLLPMDMILRCRDEHDALMLCIQMREIRYPLSEIAHRLGIDKGQWSRIMGGQAHMPTSKRLDLMELCGNYAPIQFEAWKAGYTMETRKKTPEEEMDDLRRENQLLKQRLQSAAA